MKKTKKGIYFDLGTNELREFYNAEYPEKAYSEIESFFSECGFEHVQYSGYISLKEISNKEALDVMNALFKKLPWLDNCSLEWHITEVNSTTNYLELRALKANYQFEDDLEKIGNDIKPPLNDLIKMYKMQIQVYEKKINRLKKVCKKIEKQHSK